MSVGLLIITHNGIGTELLKTARIMLGTCPLAVQALEVDEHCDPDRTTDQAMRAILEVDSGNGVLILTDIYGSTPSNIAARLSKRKNIVLVAGVNLPMLIRVLNYPRLNLQELVYKALSGGKDGVLLCNQDYGSSRDL